MQIKIFIVCQFSDKLSLLERKLCFLTGRRKFKRTGTKETVKTKWELRMQERKNSKRLFTKLVHSLTSFSCGHDMLSFNLLLSWILLSGWVSSSFCKGGEDFCSSPVCWQVCFPESMECKSSPQLLAGCPMVCCCLLLLTCCFSTGCSNSSMGRCSPNLCSSGTCDFLPGTRKDSAAEMGKFMLVLGKVCLWRVLPWQDVAAWTASAMWQRAEWGRQRGHGVWASPQMPQALSPSSLPSGLSGGPLSVLPDPDSSHEQQHSFGSC